MRCPYCSSSESKVVDKRAVKADNTIRRRRECLHCKKRYTTYEKIESISLFVLKKDGRREPFNREKLLKGLLRAFEKRPIKKERIEQIVDKIEAAVRKQKGKEVKSKLIGELMMREIKKVDNVAYIRFASVYREFKDVKDFEEELRQIKKGEK